MKSNAPWSVKGIERDTREAAKEAARREGMTVGEWLSQVIQSAGEPQATDGEIVGIKTADIVTAIEILNRRTLRAEHRSGAAIEELVRSFAIVAEKMRRFEAAPAGGGGGGSEEVQRRLAALEAHAPASREALKGLEKAVAQIAVQVDSGQRQQAERQKAAEISLSETVRRLETAFSKDNAIAAVAGVRDTVDALGARLVRTEKIASEAVKLHAEAARAIDPNFVEQTGAKLRVLGDEIKRGGDQIRVLEGAIRRMTEQIDAAEKRSADGVQKVAETLGELRDQIAQPETPAVTRADIDAAVESVTQRTEERMTRLQQSFEDMIARLDRAEPRPRFDAERALSERITSERIASDVAAPRPAVPAAQAAADVSVLDAATDADIDSDDDFRFDLDLPDEEDPFAPPAAAAPVQPTPAGTPQRAPHAHLTDSAPFSESPAAIGAADPSTRGDLDSVMRALDAFDDPPSPPPAAEPPPSPQDFLKKARIQAKETAEQLAREAAEREAAKRQMSPKQKAIAAAKARRRRLAEQGLDVTDGPLEPGAPQPRSSATLVAEKRSILGAATDLIGGIQKRAPQRASKHASAADDEFTPASDVRQAARPKQPKGIDALIAKASTRPLHLAIGVATIVVAGGAVLMLNGGKGQDQRRSAPPVAGGAAVRTPIPAPAVRAGEAAAPTEIPAAAAPLDPRTIYFESVAKLKTAKTAEQKAAAVEGLKQAAALGHPPAQLQLGELYKLGQEVPQDLALARIWYSRAANGGNVLAMHRAGVMQARGQGGAVDAEGAIAWFEKAANLGLMDSQYNLGAIYHPGGDQTTQAYQNAAQAYYWYALAARNGDTQAAQLKASLGAGLKKDERRKADEAVAAWKPGTPNAAANEIAPGN